MGVQTERIGKVHVAGVNVIVDVTFNWNYGDSALN
jgi:hypothetical protein